MPYPRYTRQPTPRRGPILHPLSKPIEPTQHDAPGPPEPSTASFFVGLAAVFLTLLTWTAAPLMVDFLAHEIDVWTSNGFRYGIAALLWSPMILYSVLKKRAPKAVWRNALIPAIFNTIGQVCFVASFYELSAELVGFLLRGHILFTTLWAFMLFPSERKLIRSPIFGIGVFAVIGGVVAVIALKDGPDTVTTQEGSLALGVLLAVVASFFFASYGVAVGKYMKNTSSFLSYAIISAYSAAILITLMLFLGEDHGATAFNLSTELWIFLFLSAVVALAIGHSSYYYGLKRVGVTTASTVLQLQPFTIVLATVLLGAMGYAISSEMQLAQLGAGLIAVVGALAIIATQAKIKRQASRARRAIVVPPAPGANTSKP